MVIPIDTRKGKKIGILTPPRIQYIISSYVEFKVGPHHEKRAFNIFFTEFNYVIYQIKGLGYNYCFNIDCKEEEAVTNIKKIRNYSTEKSKEKLLQCPKIFPIAMST